MTPQWASGRNVRKMELLEEEEEVELLMVSTISFIQTKQQHKSAAFTVLSRTASFKIIDMALIQKLW